MSYAPMNWRSTLLNNVPANSFPDNYQQLTNPRTHTIRSMSRMQGGQSTKLSESL
jgi:hypothetical protein